MDWQRLQRSDSGVWYGTDDTSKLLYLMAVIFRDNNPVLSEEPHHSLRVRRCSPLGPVFVSCYWMVAIPSHMSCTHYSTHPTSQGGSVFDYLIRDSVIPLKKWSSDTGRVVLIGDSAHAM